MVRHWPIAPFIRSSGILLFLPKAKIRAYIRFYSSLAGFEEGTSTGEGSIARSQQIQARVSVTVVGLKANGDLLVEGSRIIEINGEKEIIYLSGAINPKIIPATNVIESFRISDL